MFKPLNVFGEPLKACSMEPVTGFYRDGSCNSGVDNPAWHMICIEVTQKFLDYSITAGNDLSTPLPEYGFKGLKPGDSWCLATDNFIRAVRAGEAPKIFLESTHQAILERIDLSTLKKYAVDKV